MDIGATLLDDQRCRFTLWGPELTSVDVQIKVPREATYPLEQDEQGFWSVTVADIIEGSQYFYRINGAETWPDPASRYQPEGVHGCSMVIDSHTFQWRDGQWKNRPLQDYIIYELHIGTFTPEGTFRAAIERLSQLQLLGITAIEIMPIAQFPGDRNWGYDGVYPYAVQHSYGYPADLQQFVDACHQLGIAVILDVVYNHFGPEGNYTGCYAPFTTRRYQTPWGEAINFDDAWCDGVREFFIQNALYWLQEYHIDGLRLDAVHSIYDFGAHHFLSDLSSAVSHLSHELDKPLYLIAESDLNDTRVIHPTEQGGYGLDAQWSDDFHHSLHALLTQEHQGYYQDFGDCEALARALRDRFTYSGQYSTFRHRRHGNLATGRPSFQFVVCAQNHDQIGNRMLGERLSQLVSFEALKLAASAVLLSPYIPLLFMGEEYGETAPFLYFIDHGDPQLIEAVAQGRKQEFKSFHDKGEPLPAHEQDTFEQSKLNWNNLYEGQHHLLWRYYQHLIVLRQQLGINHPSMPSDIHIVSNDTDCVISYQRQMPDGKMLCMMNFNQTSLTVDGPPPGQAWQLMLNSAASEWDGPGSSLPESLSEQATEPPTLQIEPYSAVLYWAA